MSTKQSLFRQRGNIADDEETFELRVRRRLFTEVVKKGRE